MFLAASLGAVTAVQAVTWANVFTENFDDAALVPQLTNQNSTPISGGQSTLDGSNVGGYMVQGSAQGFTYDLDSYTNADRQFTTGWMAEMTLGAGTIQAINTGDGDTLMSVAGGIYLRASWPYNASDLNLGTVINDGGTGYNGYISTTISGGLAALKAGDHLALVYTLAANPADDTLVYYLNGTPKATLTGRFDMPTADAGYLTTGGGGFGLETCAVVPNQRGFNVSLDSVAFSVTTTIPEPATTTMLLAGEPLTTVANANNNCEYPD